MVETDVFLALGLKLSAAAECSAFKVGCTARCSL